MTSNAEMPTSGKTTWTLGAIKERNLELEGYCQREGCGQFYMFNLDGLIASAGLDYLVPEVLPGVTCAACGGSLTSKLTMTMPGDPPGTGLGSSEVVARIHFFEVEAEDAYTKMYDATDNTAATAHYSNAKEALHSAIGLADGLDDPATTLRLQDRLAHIKAVFRSQFS